MASPPRHNTILYCCLLVNLGENMDTMMVGEKMVFFFTQGKAKKGI